jgi:hypothetical protein
LSNQLLLLINHPLVLFNQPLLLINNLFPNQSIGCPIEFVLEKCFHYIPHLMAEFDNIIAILVRFLTEKNKFAFWKDSVVKDGLLALGQ